MTEMLDEDKHSSLFMPDCEGELKAFSWPDNRAVSWGAATLSTKTFSITTLRITFK